MKIFIIAKVGFNHNGDDKKALALAEVPADSGANPVKFQTFSAEKLTGKDAEEAEYEKKTTDEDGQQGVLKALEMSEQLQNRLFARCAKLGIEYMSTVFDEEAVDFLIALRIGRIKVSFGEITKVPLLRHMASKGLLLIVSPGMAELDEAVAAVNTISETQKHGGWPSLWLKGLQYFIVGRTTPLTLATSGCVT